MSGKDERQQPPNLLQILDGCLSFEAVLKDGTVFWIDSRPKVVIENERETICYRAEFDSEYVLNMTDLKRIIFIKPQHEEGRFSEEQLTRVKEALRDFPLRCPLPSRIFSYYYEVEDE